ncbi:OmpP1/FadL family transporter [Thiomicrorhabdus aquaedulcis]|uniref:OmpP1/FadL family transporter n=1 Tax=Thiomicrorhabdus aquaedulcis TaxID=2211106 RepID=UPI000FDC4177|nr:outer membrane protein transport protein [Thiomicrorhabdus aquaedulcis]
MNLKNDTKIISAVMLALVSQTAATAGFSLIEQSASGQGLSYAGAAANAEDASVMWFNPAGLTQIDGHQLIGAVHIIAPKAQFKNEGSYVGVPANTLNGAGDDGATVGLVPNFYWKGKAGDYDLGLGINVPYGQHISYDAAWVGRYHATETDLKTVNINPALARKLNDKWSFGFGLNAQYVDLILESKLNNALAGGVGDANAKITADSWAYGFNFGLLYQPTLSTDLGFAFRSKVTHDAKGKVDYSDNLNPTLAAVKKLTDANVTSTVHLPATASFSIKQAVGDNVHVLADATWTQWSDYKELEIEFDSMQEAFNARQDFKDSWRLSLGGLVELTEALKLRAGMALDQTPISSEVNRSPRTPDSDRKWVSVGLGYAMNKTLNLDVAYSHLFADRAAVNYTTDNTQYLVGSYDSAVDIVSAQLVWTY